MGNKVHPESIEENIELEEPASQIEVSIEGLPSTESVIEADPVVEEEPVVITEQPVTTECVNVENERSIASLSSYRQFRRPLALGQLLCGPKCGEIIKMVICPCCGHREIANALGKDGNLWCCGTCFLYLFCPMAAIVAGCLQRGAVRDRSGIDGSERDDLCVFLCFPSCSLVQSKFELGI